MCDSQRDTDRIEASEVSGRSAWEGGNEVHDTGVILAGREWNGFRYRRYMKGSFDDSKEIAEHRKPVYVKIEQKSRRSFQQSKRHTGHNLPPLKSDE
jgi:hypothetical protein